MGSKHLNKRITSRIWITMNYYELLELDPESSIRDIKLHYYRMAKKCHPDKHSGNLEKQEHFKKVSEAYSVLSNPRKRYIYDLKLSLEGIESAKKWNDYLNLHFSDEELLILHSYYTKIRSSTEIKFLELLFQSLPSSLRERVYQKINELRRQGSEGPEKGPTRCTQLIDISHQKVIDCTDLRESYTIKLCRSLRDVYKNVGKEIQLRLGNCIWTILVTHSDYQITFWNHGFPLILSIETTQDNMYHINGCDLHLTYTQDLYEHYYIQHQLIQLPDNTIFTHNKQMNVIEGLGLLSPETHKRGRLLIHQDLTLKLSEESLRKHHSIIKEIFH